MKEEFKEALRKAIRESEKRERIREKIPEAVCKLIERTKPTLVKPISERSWETGNEGGFTVCERRGDFYVQMKYDPKKGIERWRKCRMGDEVAIFHTHPGPEEETYPSQRDLLNDSVFGREIDCIAGEPQKEVACYHLYNPLTPEQRELENMMEFIEEHFEDKTREEIRDYLMNNHYREICRFDLEDT